MRLKTVKNILFFGVLVVFTSCNTAKNETFRTHNFNEVEPKSGWYDFPLTLSSNTHTILTSFFVKDSTGFINASQEFNQFYDSLIINQQLLSEQKILANDSVLMTAEFNHWGNIRKWVKPKTTHLTAGIPIVFKAKNGSEESVQIYFDKSKQFEDDLLVSSLIIDPKDFFSFSEGIYVQGAHKDLDWHKKGNYGKRGSDWKKPVTFHVFNDIGELILKTNAGVKIHGNLSRAQPQKSFSFTFSKNYNAKPIKSSLFGQEQKLHNLILRTPFTSAMQGQSVIMDSFIGEIGKEIGLDAMASIPSHVYLNGEYWGVYYLKEKLNEAYLSATYNVAVESIDYLEFTRNVKGYYKASSGDKSDWLKLYKFIEDNDLKEPDNYDLVCKQIDIDNLIDYLVLETFFANKDWPGNNVKFWRSSEIDNKWRFILYDMDACFRNDDMFKYILAENVKSGNNISSSTVVFRKLFKNKLFTERFVNRFNELKENQLNKDYLIGKLDDFASKIEPAIPHQINRWHMPDSMIYWESRIEKMKKYIVKRHKAYDKHINQLTF